MNRLILYDLPLPLLFGHGVDGHFFISRSQTNRIGMLDHAFRLSIYRSIYTDK